MDAMLAKHVRDGKSEILRRCADNEPVFILCGRDALAASVIQVWLSLLQDRASKEGVYGPGVMEKIDDARRVMKEMAYWPNKKLPGTEWPTDTPVQPHEV